VGINKTEVAVATALRAVMPTVTTITLEARPATGRWLQHLLL